MNPAYLWRMSDGDTVSKRVTYVDDHYNVYEVVVQDPETGKLYQFTYEADGGGNYNSWRDGDVSESDVHEVEAYEETITVTKYRKVVG